jgi:hypothetical protein
MPCVVKGLDSSESEKTATDMVLTEESWSILYSLGPPTLPLYIFYIYPEIQ